MFSKVTLLCITFPTNITSIIYSIAMEELMFLECRLITKFFPTFLAHVWFLSCMYSHVSFKILSPVEVFITEVTVVASAKCQGVKVIFFVFHSNTCLGVKVIFFVFHSNSLTCNKKKNMSVKWTLKVSITTTADDIIFQ